MRNTHCYSVAGLHVGMRTRMLSFGLCPRPCRFVTSMTRSTRAWPGVPSRPSRRSTSSVAGGQMVVVDASCLCAVVIGGPGAEGIRNRLSADNDHAAPHTVSYTHL